MMASFKLVARVASVVLLLIVHEPSSRLASAQLEAVGAIMSVVPVTSILATAGLVGVKLVALSRLLDVLGYDRAYLAQGGSGTAAQPIGLEKKYAYMFPYVPGLNISVSGEDSIGMREPALETKTEPHRKTYPAMGLPGDYEKVRRPFRGSEALQDVFRQAGIKAYLPTTQQQQQLQQKFNLPPQDPIRTDKIANNNNNQHHQQQPQQTHNSPHTSPHVVPSNVVPGHRDANSPNAQPHQSASGQSSSSSHSQQVPASNQQQQQQADAVAQVNRPNQSNSHSNSNSNSNDSRPPNSTPSGGHLIPNQSLPSIHDDLDPARQPERQTAPPTFSQLHWATHAVIPQRDEFHRRLLASGLHRERPQPPVVQIGHLSHSESAHAADGAGISVAPHSGIQAVELIPSNPVNNNQRQQPHFQHPPAHIAPAHFSHPFNSFSAVPESMRPPAGHTSRHPFPWNRAPAPTPPSQGNGFSAVSNEMTTNFFPRPFDDSDDFPTTLADDAHSNELDRIHHGRRRKRSPDLGLSQAARSVIGATPAPLQQASRPEPSASQQTFGMPALNIHSLRRRRRKRQAVLAAASLRRLT